MKKKICLLLCALHIALLCGGCALIEMGPSWFLTRHNADLSLEYGFVESRYLDLEAWYAYEYQELEGGQPVRTVRLSRIEKGYHMETEDASGVQSFNVRCANSGSGSKEKGGVFISMKGEYHIPMDGQLVQYLGGYSTSEDYRIDRIDYYHMTAPYVDVKEVPDVDYKNCVSHVAEFAYDEGDRLIRQTLTSPENETSTRNYSYGGNGRLARVEEFGPDGQMTMYLEYTQDGLAQTETAFAPDGSILGSTVITYDAEGYILTEEGYNEAGEKISQLTFDYSVPKPSTQVQVILAMIGGMVVFLLVYVAVSAWKELRRK